MTVYHKILVPYDSSKPSETALEHAIQIAKMSGIPSRKIVNVILLYITPTIHIPFTFGTILLKSEKTGQTIPLREYTKELNQEIKENAIKKLDEKIKKYGNIENVSLESRVVIGDPSDEIIKFVNDEKIDLIIMGTTGLGGIKKFVFGSVARNVSEKAKCPVMLVR
jgi:nucleotide-binding universal stress UspA family protein